MLFVNKSERLAAEADVFPVFIIFPGVFLIRFKEMVNNEG